MKYAINLSLHHLIRALWHTDEAAQLPLPAHLHHSPTYEASALLNLQRNVCSSTSAPACHIHTPKIYQNYTACMAWLPTTYSYVSTHSNTDKRLTALSTSLFLRSHLQSS